MIACLLDLRSVGLGRVTFPRLVHYSPRSGQTRVAIGAAACTIAADRDRGSICIHCDDDDPRVAVFVFGGMQHATDGRTDGRTDCKWRRWISTRKGGRGALNKQAEGDFNLQCLLHVKSCCWFSAQKADQTKTDVSVTI